MRFSASSRYNYKYQQTTEQLINKYAYTLNSFLFEQFSSFFFQSSQLLSVNRTQVLQQLSSDWTGEQKTFL